jgi:hypothetical protein
MSRQPAAGLNGKCFLNISAYVIITFTQCSSKCSGQFQVAEASDDDRKSDQENEAGGKEQGERGDDNVEDIISPAASYVVRFLVKLLITRDVTVEQSDLMQEIESTMKIHKQAMPTKHTFSAVFTLFAWISRSMASIHPLWVVNPYVWYS